MQNLRQPAVDGRGSAAKKLAAALHVVTFELHKCRELSGGAVTAGANNVIVFCLTKCLALRRNIDSVNGGFVHWHLRKLIIIDRRRSVKLYARGLFARFMFLDSNESSYYTILLLRWLLLLYNISTRPACRDSAEACLGIRKRQRVQIKLRLIMDGGDGKRRNSVH